MRKIENFEYHDNAVRALNAQLSAAQISHAYLFCGSEATLKKQLAHVFAEAINNVEGDDAPHAKSGQNIDIHQYAPDSARGYLVDQIRDIIADAQRAPINAPYKINIISHAEKLTTATANAFLKTLEEPPAYVVNILLAQNVDEVLPTIVSRCQVFHLSDIAQKTAIKMVAEQSGAAPADAQFFYDAANRSVSKAVRYLQNQHTLDLVNYCKRVYGDVCGLSINTMGRTDSGQATAALATSAPKISDYEVTKYSAAILKGIDEITKSQAAELAQKLAENEEFLDGPAIKQAEKANKRQVSAMQTEMLHLVTNVFCVLSGNALKENALLQGSLQQASPKNNANNAQATAQENRLIEELFSLSNKLSYNIAPKNYCDVLLLTIAHAADNTLK